MAGRPEDTDPTRARRARPVAVALAVAFVVVVAGALVIPRLGHSTTAVGRDEAERFLDAWSSGDIPAMQALVTDPQAPVGDDLKTIEGGLRLTDASYRLGSVGRPTGAKGDVPVTFTADVTVAGLGRWSYQGALTVVRTGAGPRVEWGPSVVHPALAAGQVLARSRQWAPRAAILDGGEAPMVAAIDVVTINIEPRRVADRPALTKVLADTLQVDPATVDAALARPGVKPDQLVPVITVRRDVYLAHKPVLYPVPGLVFTEGKGRGPSTSGFAKGLLGRTGEVTAERLAQLGAPYEVGDVVGLSGLEAAYERSLAGSPSGDVHVAEGDKPVGEPLQRFDGVAPKPLRTTIDPTIQQAAEAALAGVDLPAAFVAVDRTGAVKAVVSRPVDGPERAIAGQYPPGSTFKIVTADALLSGGLKPADPVPCEPEVVVDGRAFHNFEKESAGTISFSDAFARSCNTAFISAGARLSGDQLGAAARRFGFDQPYDLGLPTGASRLGDPAAAVDLAATDIGQGKVLVSPLHLASVAGAVQTGTWHQPVLLPDEHPATVTAEPLDAGIRDQLADLMHRVVSDGTGTAAAVAGRDIAGKTGTAEFGSDVPPKTHAWFVGFSGDLSVAVLVEGGGVGGERAAPIAARFFAALSR